MSPLIDINKIIAIAKEAGDAILELILQNDIKTITNDPSKPITNADLISNDILHQKLSELDLGFPIISENSSEEIDDHISSSFWLIDPLDGTKELIQNRGDFTVNIAYVENGYPVLGVVHIPTRNETFYGILREGAYKTKDGIQKRLEARKFGFSDRNLVVVCSRNNLDVQTEQFMEVLNHPNVKHHGSSLKFTEIAEGKAHLYPRFSPTRSWDTAAAQIITEEAGGKVMDMVTGKRLYYKTPRQTNNGILVTGGVQIPEAVWHRFQQF